ncbi:hypothetical protein L596_020226 [Steinernema carpocapsae]|uniref:Nucleolus and neural progenitor protein-like N-terminal domain-containing protein n=1 Tax=Steinernema carpocapsae TaxID=34508 RepID=A0A4U5MTK0_STECR|nr:hypothetical protein L596_020226 [Steinernema carpocapsae]
MDLELLQFVDDNVLQKPARMIKSSKAITDADEVKSIEKLRFRLSAAVFSLQKCGINDAQTSVNGQILSALKYKFSNPFRHMKFWANVKKLHSQLRKLDAEGLRQTIRRLADVCLQFYSPFLTCIVKAVCIGNLYYPATPEYLTHIGSLILNRLFRLDRIRVTAAKMAYVCMGYIDIGNWMTINLLLVSVASDIAKDCLGQIIELSLIYNELVENLRQGSVKLPKNASELRFQSIRGGEIINGLTINKPDVDLLGTIIYTLEISEADLAENYKNRLIEASRYDRQTLQKSLNIGVKREEEKEDEEERSEGEEIEMDEEKKPKKTKMKKTKKKEKKMKILKKVIGKKNLKKTTV